LNIISEADSIGNNAIGLKNDMISILDFMHIPYADSSKFGSWKNIVLVQNNATINSNTTTTKNIMPNVLGMGLKDAVYLLENKGLSLAFQGKGKVMAQSIVAGTNFSKGQKITLLLN
jgi:cell division protein FtsI (penicillin-binding protein 3)